MATANLVRRYISRLSRGQVFATRELLTFGKRGAIDKTLHRLVTKGAILRLARGIFVRADINLKTPSVEEIVRAKARAYSKMAVSLGSTIAPKYDLKKNTKGKSVCRRARCNNLNCESESPAGSYGVVGAASSFQTLYGRVFFRSISPRKHILAQHKVGRILVALWHLGKNSIVDFEALQRRANLKRPEKKMIRELAAWTPAWLNQYFLGGRFRSDLMTPADLHSYKKSKFGKKKEFKKSRKKHTNQNVIPECPKIGETPAYYMVA